jgi:uncharacterized protein (TIGR02145 family)
MKNIFFISIGLLIFHVTLAQSGNVGIGTTTPTAKLHVNGSVKITDGTEGAGKVLTSDASGKGTWQTMTTSSSSLDSIGVGEIVWIGCNAWMTKNLDVDHYRNGDPIPKVSYPGSAGAWAALTTGAYCYFNNDSATYAAIYGKLYNWYAVNDPRGLAPEGWHIPSDFEWTTLINTLGGNTMAGGPMKAMGTTDWNAPNLGATNLCNFTAKPGGQRSSAGSYTNEGNFGYWWSITPAASNLAWSRNINYNDMQVAGAATDFHVGYSVRCVKD